jgi:hypothetical protein
MIMCEAAAVIFRQRDSGEIAERWSHVSGAVVRTQTLTYIQLRIQFSLVPRPKPQTIFVQFSMCSISLLTSLPFPLSFCINSI